MVDDSHPAHLSPSELGTKEYWETFYARTLSHISTKHNNPTAPYSHNTASSKGPNPVPEDEDSEDSEDSEEYEDDDSDPGTSWFSEHNAPDKVLQFLTSEDFPLAPSNTLPFTSTPEQKHEQQPSILDLGTGNGSMLALLRKRGRFRGEMVGVDYSPRSVELARELQRLKIHSAYLTDSEDDSDDADGDKDGGKEEDGGEIRFEEWDILKSDKGGQGDLEKVDWFPGEKGGFDIVLDKGTFDAVSLSDETVPATGTATGTKKVVVKELRVCEQYPGIARRLVRKGGFLVVTSCNWTEEELIRWFTRTDDAVSEHGPGDRLEVWGKVEYPRFRFGGREGQGVCTVCFQRV